MSIKILGGKAKGTNLFLPEEKLVRPTLVLLKRRIFDSFQNLEGVIFLDGCAGSGSMGLEAWSRGCDELYLVEPNQKVLPVLKKNVEKVLGSHSEDSAKVELISMPFRKYLKIFKQSYLALENDQKENTIIFLDPPYHMEKLYKSVIKDLQEDSWFIGQLWIESDKKIGVPVTYWEELGLNIIRTYAQSQSYILVVNF
jgi:16S rRNA (guanine966-N2)-methyltransferase